MEPRGGRNIVAEMDYSRRETPDLFAFHRAKKSACIDYADFTTGEAIALPPTKGRVVWHSGKSGFTIHDPSPADLHALDGLVLARLEVAVDVYPRTSMPPKQRRRDLADVFECITRRIWPFDGDGLQHSYRASKAQGQNDWLVQTIDYGYGEEPSDRRMPSIKETLYLGHHYAYARADTSLPNTAQMRVYYKQTDNREALPENKHVIRTEVTLSSEWLRARGISKTGHLAGFAFRKQLSPYFRFLRPEADRIASVPNGSTRLIRLLNDTRARVLTRAAITGGVASWLFEQRAKTDRKQRDVEMCRAFGIALDNLGRLYPEASERLETV
jgi:hypothetical protein